MNEHPWSYADFKIDEQKVDLLFDGIYHVWTMQYDGRVRQYYLVDGGAIDFDTGTKMREDWFSWIKQKLEHDKIMVHHRNLVDQLRMLMK